MIAGPHRQAFASGKTDDDLRRLLNRSTLPPLGQFLHPRSSMARRDLCLLLFCGFAAPALFLGCGQANPLGRHAISGNVTLDGGPLEQGNIEFHPMFEGGVQSGGRITGGSYSIPAHDGVTPGKYRVSISDFVPTPPLPPGHMPGDPLPPSPKPKVPAEWNSKSQQTVEVKKEGPFKFDFDILTKKK
jgi:hypothetical protein